MKKQSITEGILEIINNEYEYCTAEEEYELDVLLSKLKEIVQNGNGDI